MILTEKCGFVKRWPRSYAFIMIVGTLIITVLFIFIYGALHLKSREFWYMVASCIVSSLVCWFGSGSISMYLTKKIDVFVKPARLLFLLSVSLIAYSTIIVLAEIALVEHIYNFKIEQAMKISTIVISVLITLFITAIHTSYYFFQSWKENMTKAERLEKENLKAQYETLKNQVNPHFVFNSLNTLLTMVECNPDAVKYVESLSDLLRYVLQTREKEAVLLRDELNMAKQYVYVQKGRFGDKLNVNIDIPESYYHYAIPPLVLQMLLENAIKHNVIARDNILRINVYIDDKQYIVVENKINLKEDIEISTGIGLNNIKNRYIFLSGKAVIINEDDGTFSVKLPLIEFKL
jgi:sensor histidine kinase YesM